MPRKSKNEAANVSPIATAEPMSFTPGPGWFSARQATEFLGWPEDQVQKVRNAIKNRAEFREPGAIKLLAIDGYDMPPLTFVSQAALEAYRENSANGAGNARVRNGAKRWIIRLTPDQEALFNETFGAQQGVKLEVASTPKKPKSAADQSAATASPDTAAEPTPESDEASLGADPDDDQDYYRDDE